VAQPFQAGVERDYAAARVTPDQATAQIAGGGTQVENGAGHEPDRSEVLEQTVGDLSWHPGRIIVAVGMPDEVTAQPAGMGRDLSALIAHERGGHIRHLHIRWSHPALAGIARSRNDEARRSTDGV
jgi:hypothetical protein